jgi:hypothetical protein
MMYRATICCAALIFGLLAALSVTAQSAGACNGTACASGKPQPLNLMSFMGGSAKAGSANPAGAKTATASTTKRRHATSKTAARPYRDVTPASAASAEPSALPVAAAIANASQSADDVQVVSGDELNAIDLAMNSAATETSGAASRNDSDARDRFQWADATQFRANQDKPDNAAVPSNQTPGSGIPRDDSWIGRFWSALGDGFVALVGMVQQLFG